MHLLDLLYPPVCQRCGQLGKWICRRCWSHFSWLSQPRFKPANAYPSLDCVWSAVQYDEISGKCIQGLKYSRYRVLAQPLGDMLARQCTDMLHRWKVDAIIPVPLHQKRYQVRGFNQAGLLAQQIGRRTNIPVDTSFLIRAYWSTSQAKQNKSGRQNLHHMFRCTRRTHYETVCLIDDVCTTGATLSACTRALNLAGVKRVIAITVARA